MSIKNILILNCFSRNALAAINALDDRFHIIAGGPASPVMRRIWRPFVAPRVKEMIWYADPGENPDKFTSDIISSVRENKIDGIIATGTATSNCLSMNKAIIERETSAMVLIEDFEKLERVTDKWLFAETAQALNIPIPKTAPFSKITTLKQAIAEHQFVPPFLIKPTLLSGSVGLRFFYTEEQLDTFCSECEQNGSSENLGSYVIQELIQGSLHDVTGCAYKGEALALLSQERLQTMWDFGGGGILNRTSYEKEILDHCRSLLKEIEWNGIVEFDFLKADSDGAFYLIECNPKIWGTTQLTIDAGLNVIQMMVDSQLMGKTVEPIETYNVGLVYKWLYPDCLAHWFTKPLTIYRVCSRIIQSFRKYDGSQTKNNLNFGDIGHLTGIVINSLLGSSKLNR